MTLSALLLLPERRWDTVSVKSDSASNIYSTRAKDGVSVNCPEVAIAKIIYANNRSASLEVSSDFSGF